MIQNKQKEAFCFNLHENKGVRGGDYIVYVNITDGQSGELKCKAFSMLTKQQVLPVVQ